MSDLKKSKAAEETVSETRKSHGKMTLKQIAAWIAIVLLVGMYVFTLICSIINSPLAEQMFHATLYCTFFIPVIAWVFIMTVKLVKGNGDDIENRDQKK